MVSRCPVGADPPLACRGESGTCLQISREHVLQLALPAPSPLLLLLLVPLGKAWLRRALGGQLRGHHCGRRRGAQTFCGYQARQSPLEGEPPALLLPQPVRPSTPSSLEENPHPASLALPHVL